MNMDSGSEDEFFDATEDLSPKKSVGKAVKSQMLSEIQAEAESGLKENQKVVKEQPKLLKQSSSESLETERENMLMKDSEIVNLQTQEQTKLVEISQHIEQVKISTDDDNSTKKISQTIDTSNLPTDTKVELNIETITKTIETTATQNTNIETKATQNTNIESSPPAPVAPPRRKRKQKKDVKQDEKNEVKKNTAAEDIDNEVSKVMNTEKNENAPFIKVSLSTNEMSQVLESGNSLEVVFNNDLMTRRSGGPLTSPSSPEIRNAKTGLLRVNSISGRPLTDAEILEQVGIKNLDTGETIPLSLAEEKLPECTNPLALHILRLATEQNSGTNLPEYDEGHLSDASVASGGKIPGKKKKLKKFFGKTVEKIRAVADGRRMDESSSSDDEQLQDDGGYIKFKNHRAIKERLMFNKIKLLQDLSGEHIGAVWTMKFSLCGKLLATAGQDNIVVSIQLLSCFCDLYCFFGGSKRQRVWVLKESASNFEEMRLKYSRPTGRKSPTESMTSSTSVTSTDEDPLVEDLLRAHGEGDDENDVGPFRRAPFVSYHGHTSDVLDLSWSKNYFLLSSSMDKTVRLWHISRQECLCCFQHVDFVTAICFHPKDDRYFLSGSLDGKIRLWNIPEKKVALWNEIDGSGTSLITAANFCQNGKLAVVGTYDGRCIFYDTERLKYHTQVTVRSSRGKNARGRKISGIEPMPGEDKVLITSNDSRIRLYDLKDHSLYCKYKGLNNESSQIRAGFSHDGKMILCGSEDKFVYIWQTHHDVANVRNDRNEYYECFSAHDAVVTAAIFAPYPATIMEKVSEEASETDAIFSNRSTVSKDHLQKPFEVLVAADWHGGVKLFINK